MACNGSIFMTKNKKFEVDDTITEEGNAAHYLAEQVFKGLFTADELIDRKAPNGVFITAEMADHVDGYLRDIKGKGFVEIDTSYRDTGWEVRGRADHISFEGGVLYVDDFKYGWKIVEPDHNWTLISHAVGWMINNWGEISAVKSVVFRIYQPRPYHPRGAIRQWSISTQELMGFASEIKSALSKPEQKVLSGSHCYKCPSLASCPSTQIAAMNAIDVSEQAFDSNMSNDDLSYVLEQFSRAKDALEQFIDAAEDMLKHRLKAGQAVKGWGLQIDLGQKKWLDGVTPEFIEALTGVDVSKKSLITPNQAKKAGVLEDVVESLCDRPTKGVKLVKVDENKRAEQLFGKKGK